MTEMEQPKLVKITSSRAKENLDGFVRRAAQGDVEFRVLSGGRRFMVIGAWQSKEPEPDLEVKLVDAKRDFARLCDLVRIGFRIRVVSKRSENIALLSRWPKYRHPFQDQLDLREARIRQEARDAGVAELARQMSSVADLLEGQRQTIGRLAREVGRQRAGFPPADDPKLRQDLREYAEEVE